MSGPPVVIMGMGQVGGVFAHGLLAAGRPVYPLRRGDSPEALFQEIPDPALVLVCVGEAALRPAVESLPDAWLDRLGLVQNELLPAFWQGRGIPTPSVAVIWFEKKRDTPLTPIRPTAVYGPRSALLASGLEALGVPVRQVGDEEGLVFELLLKMLYLWTLNFAGLEMIEGSTAAELRAQRPDLYRSVSGEVLELLGRMAGAEGLDRERFLRGLDEAISARPAQRCTGRRARQRLERALAHARRFDLALPALERIARP